MPEKTAGQDFAVRILKSHVTKDRLAHTYLLTGKNEAASARLALEFAKTLLCEKNIVFESCDCTSCRKIENQNHPDVRWLGRDSGARSIKIETVREMLGWANLKPYEGRRKVFIFMGAERLTPEAQNALLKTLEEPPAETIFCLLVESKSHLLETIQSRSFEIRLWPDECDMNVGASPCACLEGGHGGSPLQGIEERNWFHFLDPYQTTPREEVKTMLDSLMAYFRNQWEQKSVGATPRGRPHAGQAQGPVPTAYLQAFDMVYETKEALEANANQKLAMTRLTMQLNKIAGATHAPPLCH